MKLHVNVPRHRRDESGSNMEVRKNKSFSPMDVKYKEVRKGTREKAYNEVWKEKKKKKSFAETVKGTPDHERWKGPIVATQKQIMPWMESSTIGHMAQGMDFYQVNDELIKGGMSIIKIRYMGDNMVLLIPNEGERMEDIIKLNKECFEGVFDLIDPFWRLDCWP